MKKMLAVILMSMVCVMSVAQMHHHTSTGHPCQAVVDMLAEDGCDDDGCHGSHQGKPCQGCGVFLEALPESLLESSLLALAPSGAAQADLTLPFYASLCGMLCEQLLQDNQNPKHLLETSPHPGLSPGVQGSVKRRGPPEYGC